MADDPIDLVGTFVVEVGERQAWRFLTFCDNESTPPKETRLYIDTDYELAGADDLANLMMLTVERVTVDGAALRLNTGSVSLDVSGTPNASTSHDVWWLGGS